jgi:hypothetical protein
MSQYTIKLEQLISSQDLGDFLITVQYDAMGPKIISIEGEKLSNQLQEQISPVLQMINLCLTKGIAIKEIADLVPTFGNGQMAAVFELIMESLKIIPNRIQEIHSDNVIEIKSEMLKALS